MSATTEALGRAANAAIAGMLIDVVYADIRASLAIAAEVRQAAGDRERAALLRQVGEDLGMAKRALVDCGRSLGGSSPPETGS